MQIQVPTIEALSENTLIILFEQKIDRDVFQQVKACVDIIESQFAHYITDIVPAYCSIHILFKLREVSSRRFIALLQESLRGISTHTLGNTLKGKLIEIPVYYGLEVALDIEVIASSANVSVDDVISLYTEAVYDVYAIGFAPGFAYLGNVNERIAHARKQTPRANITAGSVGIADTQTAIYPSNSPGGWQIIGRTPISMIDYKEEQLTRFVVGDRVKFIPISRAEYLGMGGLLDDTSADNTKR